MSDTANHVQGAAAASSPSAPVSQPAPAADEPAPLEIDDATSTTDGASTIDDRISSYTASLSSSVVDYPIEYGRRYHAFRPGSYPFPNDETEMDRLDMTHALMVKAIHNRLFLAPLVKEKVHRILEIGTGTGIWAVEMGDIFPNAEVIGVDLSAIQPSWAPPNVKFEIDDVESPWVNNRKYDYIFCRFMVGSIGDWPKLVKRIYDNLNPGGWVEFQDIDGIYYSDDGSYTEEHATNKWNKLLDQTLNDMGREGRPGPKLEGWARDAGFQEISHKVYKIPIGPWAKDPHYQELGLLNLAQLLEGLEGFTMRAYCGFLGKTREEALATTALVRKELKTLHLFHSQFDVHVVYGQKPLEEETTE